MRENFKGVDIAPRAFNLGKPRTQMQTLTIMIVIGDSNGWKRKWDETTLNMIFCVTNFNYLA